MLTDDNVTPQARIDAALERGEVALALALSEAAVAAQPNAIWLACNHAKVLRRAGRHEEAMAFLRTLDERQPDRVPILMAMVTTARASGEPDLAMALSDRVLGLKPDHTGALKVQGQIALARNDLSAALTAIQAALVQDNRQTMLYCHRAEILRRMGCLAEALSSMDDLDSERQSDAPVRLHRARILRDMGDLTTAADLFSDVLSDDPAHKGAMVGQIDIALASGTTDIALDFAKEALRRFPDDPVIASRHALALHKTDRSDEALALLKSLGDVERQATQVAVTTGEILLALGRRKEAAAIFEQVAEDDPASQAASLALINPHSPSNALISLS